ncbi:hypothetical protein KJA13_03080 [Patescibacteria group bacterium]|nr:hypothetical protein [Patescibacteria group bacterium]
MNKIQEFAPDLIADKKNSLYICAAGFEDRVKGVVEKLKEISEKVFKYSNILEYYSSVSYKQTQKKKKFLEKNKENLDFLQSSLKNLSTNMLENTIIDIDYIFKTNNNFKNMLIKNIPATEIDSIFIDISGMANFLILLTLYQTSKIFHDKEIFVLYTEAQNYFPQKDEKDEILQFAEARNENSITRLGELLGASGARETMILPYFKGYFKEDFPICLIFFVGYEPSRAIGLLDAYHPNIVITCYGVSPHEHFKWRTEFSKELHSKLKVFEQYPSSKTEISTFNIQEIISKLEEIYISADREGKILYENYNIGITPQCSKLQTVATYLFCQSHPDVQVVFCLPGLFNPERYSKEIGKSWLYKLLI